MVLLWRSGDWWRPLETGGEGQESILILRIICTTLNSRSPAPGGYTGISDIIAINNVSNSINVINISIITVIINSITHIIMDAP